MSPPLRRRVDASAAAAVAAAMPRGSATYRGTSVAGSATSPLVSRSSSKPRAAVGDPFDGRPAELDGPGSIRRRAPPRPRAANHDAAAIHVHGHDAAGSR